MFAQEVRSGYITGEKLTTAWRCTAHVIRWATAESGSNGLRPVVQLPVFFCVVPEVYLSPRHLSRANPPRIAWPCSDCGDQTHCLIDRSLTGINSAAGRGR